MADFSFLSDSDDEKAVEELLSQATELSVLEQVAAINCAGFTDSVLPTPLETRFAKLKSFPSAASKRKSSTHCKSDCSSLFKNSDKHKSELSSLSDDDVETGGGRNTGEEEVFKDNSKSGFGAKCLKSFSSSSKDEKFSHSKDLKENLRSGLHSSPSKLFDISSESEKFSSFRKTQDDKKGRKLKFADGKIGKESKSPSDSSTESNSLSPPQRSGCLWCSPKRVSLSRKKSKENRVSKIDFDWDKNDEFLSDLSTFSSKSQQKLLEKAMKEEEKISREAEKIVKWAKQASARMEVFSVEDVLSDNGSFK